LRVKSLTGPETIPLGLRILPLPGILRSHLAENDYKNKAYQDSWSLFHTDCILLLICSVKIISF
jgi:hypothetical protein